ncbi:MAG: Rrf2 family transcriptional regulator [Thermodesulfobacteriaceae bacterium]|nr:Rrf2 family transcriptional regulator [Caldimicrobium sp.]MCX8041237.1 Rrf2 family transcriptional regulator [Thermodesulfobacteriaceae bacterium]MDW8135487.1 Rrf2 family transcriptional regulator [Thermodesulfobacterium sp.]
MFKLSTKGRYAVRAMYEIAKAHPKGLTLDAIAENQKISRVYLAQILNRLRQARLIKSSRGPGGGYVLRKSPDEISLYEILEPLEGPVCVASCVDPTEGCDEIEECVAYPVWKKIAQYIECLLKEIKLGDLLRAQGEQNKAKLLESVNLKCF